MQKEATMRGGKFFFQVVVIDTKGERMRKKLRRQQICKPEYVI
jgi:hypothetical protein